MYFPMWAFDYSNPPVPPGHPSTRHTLRAPFQGGQNERQVAHSAEGILMLIHQHKT